MPATVNTKSFERKFRKMIRGLSPKGAERGVYLTCRHLLNVAIRSPIPSDTRALANSDAINIRISGQTKLIATFGFNKAYAAFQDQPGKSGIVEVRPVRKKMLYVPISQRGRLHRLGNNPRNEGLVYGEDYVLKKVVRISIKPYGSPKGPNHYFSETLKRQTDDTFQRIARIVTDRLRRVR